MKLKTLTISLGIATFILIVYILSACSQVRTSEPQQTLTPQKTIEVAGFTPMPLTSTRTQEEHIEIEPSPTSTSIPPTDLFGLPITMNAGNNRWIELFNSFARDGDMKTGDIIGFAESSLENRERYERLLSAVEKGLIFQNFASYATARVNIDYLAGKIDGISYDLEQWEKSKNEWDDISAASKIMSEIARQYNLYYYGALSYQLAQEPGSIEAMAEFMDAYGPHSHGFLKENPDGYVNLLSEQAARARTANPDIIIEIMVSTADDAPPVDKIFEIIQACLGFADRVMIYHTNTDESYRKTVELLHLLRGD